MKTITIDRRGKVYKVSKLALVAVSMLVAGLLAGAASGRHNAPPDNRVVTCPGHSFSFAFDPKRGVVVRSGNRILATASVRGSKVSKVCTPVVEPHWGGGMADLSNNIYRRVTIRCRVDGPLSIYLAPAHNGRASTRNILVMTGDPLRNVVGAGLKPAVPPTPLNISQQRAPFLYRLPENCGS